MRGFNHSCNTIQNVVSINNFLNFSATNKKSVYVYLPTHSSKKFGLNALTGTRTYVSWLQVWPDNHYTTGTNLTASWVFTDLHSNSPEHSPWFSPRYDCKENMFYFLNTSVTYIPKSWQCFIWQITVRTKITIEIFLNFSVILLNIYYIVYSINFKTV